MRTTTVTTPRHRTSVHRDIQTRSHASGLQELCPSDKVLCTNGDDMSMRNLHVGDDSKYVVAKLSAEDIEYFRPQLKKNRKPQYTPSAHDSVERLACLGGMALDRTDVFEAETAFVFLQRRFHSALMPAERALILEAMCHVSGYEGRVFYLALKRICDKPYDEYIPSELATYRLLFYRYCPSPLVKSISRDADCKRWLQMLKDWMTELEEGKAGYWEDQPLATNFLRQCYIYRTGCKYLADGDEEQTEYYRSLIYNSFFDCLLKFQKTSGTDARTVVSAWNAFREFKNGVKANEQRYKVFMGKVNSTQATLSKQSNQWLQLEEVRLDYEVNNNDFPFRFICK